MDHADVPPRGSSSASPSAGLKTTVVFGWLAAATLVAYWPALNGPFIFHDVPALVREATIRDESSFANVWLPGRGTGAGVVGRPLVDVSLAVNYALGGTDPWSYHVFNVLMHAAAAGLLFAVLRRTLQHARVATADGLALAASWLWALHPVQTAAVAGVLQRGELLGSSWYLLTLYGLIRAAERGGSNAWAAVSVLACALGMLTHELVATAPLIALLYDRAFLAGSFAAAWRARRRFYCALGATWIPLGWLVLRVAEARTSGAGEVGLGDHLLNHCSALVHYVKLSFWPEPLVLDYGTTGIRPLPHVGLHASIVLALLVAMVIALVRWPRAGFLGAWFFLTLAATSSLAAFSTQNMAEHRIYLPLAAIVAAVVLVARTLSRGPAMFVAAVLLACACGVATRDRARDYRSAVSIWSDTVAEVPENAPARYRLGNALVEAGRPGDAIAEYRAAVRLAPRFTAAHFKLGGALLQLGRLDDAVASYETALRLEPGSPDAHANLAAALLRLNRIPEAVAHYEAAAQAGMLAAEEQRRFGRALAEMGRIDDALKRLQAALRLEPNYAETHVLLGVVLSAADRGPEALKHFTEAVVLAPDDAGAHASLADALLEGQRPAEALAHYRTALRLRPAQAAQLHTPIANALIRLGRVTDAIAHYEEALRLDPTNQEARRTLNHVRATAQRRGLLKE